MKDLEQIICEIDGSWLTNLNFGSEELWNINE
jgi:hypothetical protein